MSAVCVFEARLALMSAALRATVAREQHDDATAAMWRDRADDAREWLRQACAADEPDQLVLQAARVTAPNHDAAHVRGRA